MAERYVVVGLGRARASWLRSISQWSTSGVVPVEFLKCLTPSEIYQRLADLRPYSAIVVEAGVAGLDRDLIDAAKQSGIAVFVVARQGHDDIDWVSLGVSAVLPSELSPTDLLYALTSHAATIRVGAELEASTSVESLIPSTGDLIAVCGPGGTGASTLAIALSQGLARDPQTTVALVDLARNGEQAMLHHTGDIVPGLEELIDASRNRHPSAAEVQALTFAIIQRDYRLLVGQRRVGAWSSMPPRAIATAIDALQQTFNVTIADITADFETEHDGGSADVEERNALALTAIRNARLIVVVGCPDMKGVHATTRTVHELVSRNVEPDRILTVFNRISRSSYQPKELKSAYAALANIAELPQPLFIPDKSADRFLRDMAALPKAIVDPITSAVRERVVVQHGAHIAQIPSPEAVVPGSLGMLDDAVGE